MFGGNMKRLQTLAIVLSSICPPWNARVMRFSGGLEAVVFNRMPSGRTALFTQSGQWQNVVISLDEDGDVLGASAPMPLGKRSRDVSGLVDLVVAYNVSSCRGILGISDDPIAALEGRMASDADRAWAKQVLPYLTVGGR